MSDSILKVGRVVEVSGPKVVGELESSVEELYRTYKSRRYLVGQIGSIVKIEVSDRLVFGVVTALRMAEVLNETGLNSMTESNSNAKWLEIELFGEAIRTGLDEGDFEFDRGVVNFPLPGNGIFVATSTELSQIYRQPNKPSIHVGTLSQSSSLPVHLLTNELLGKHFAVLGTTGSGKSCAVTVLLQSILKKSPHAHIILLDPHNEYSNAFKECAEVIDPTSLDLPHWLMNFEESISLFVGKTEFVATSQTNILKEAILNARKNFKNSGNQIEKVTVDTPIPYTVDQLIINIDSAMNLVGNSIQKQDPYKKILNKIETLRNDSRFSFLIQPDHKVDDDLKNLIARFFRIPVSNKPLSIIDLSGVPSDVVDVVVSVLCRMIFDFAVWSPRPVEVPLLLVCEEAHRYAPSKEEAAFQPTKKALSRIAKEGRKYGVSLGLVSQRPSELAESILSQCNTLIALRMSNEQDQNFVKRALPDSVQSLVNVLPILKSQEALVVGEGSVVPVRLKFNNIAEDNRPQSMNVPFSELWSKEISNPEDYIVSVIQKWRLQQR